jgi:1-deoxy-D-xylulose-5-phosphate synthase
MRPMTLPDRFIDQDTPEKMYAAAHLDARSIVATALNALGREKEALAARESA